MLQKIKWTNCWPRNYSPSRLIKQFPACPPTSSGDVLTKSNKIIAAVTSLHSHLWNKLDAVSSPWRNWWFLSAVFDCQMQPPGRDAILLQAIGKKQLFFFLFFLDWESLREEKCWNVHFLYVIFFFFLRGKGFFCHVRLLRGKVVMLLETSQANQSVHSSLVQILSLPSSGRRKMSNPDFRSCFKTLVTSSNPCYKDFRLQNFLPKLN